MVLEEKITLWEIIHGYDKNFTKSKLEAGHPEFTVHGNVSFISNMCNFCTNMKHTLNGCT